MFARIFYFIVAVWLAGVSVAAWALPAVGTTLTRTGDTTLVLTFSDAAAFEANTATLYTLSGTGGFSGSPSSAVLDISGTSLTLTVPSMAALIHGSTVVVTVANTLAARNLVATYTVDAVPAAFSFASIAHALTAKDYESTPMTVSGINTTLTVGTTSDANASLKCARLAKGSSTWGTFGVCTALAVGNGDQLKLQLTSASDFTTTVSGGIVLAGVSATFAITTLTAEASVPVAIPSNVGIATLTSLTSVLAAPPAALYMSSNAVIVVPSSVSGTISVLPTATDKAAFSVASGSIANFSMGGSTLSLTVTGQNAALLVLKKFKLDNFSDLQVLELSSGQVRVSRASGTAPIIGLQLGNTSPAAQVVLMHAGSATATVEVTIGEDASAQLGVTAGRIGLRKASAASTVALTDATTDLYADEVASLAANGSLAQIRVGSLANTGSRVGDPMTFTDSTWFYTDIARLAKVPRLDAALPRLGSSDSLLKMLFGTIGLQSNLGNNEQTDQGVVPLLIDGVRYYFVPIGDVTVDTTRANGVALSDEGLWSITRNGVTAHFRPTVFDTSGFATSMQASLGATVTLNDLGLIEVAKDGNTLLMVPEIYSLPSTETTEIAFDPAGMIVFTKNGQAQRMLPTLYDSGQFSSAFASFASKIGIRNNADGTYQISLIDVASDGSETVTEVLSIAVDYQIVSPLVVQNTHLDDDWWMGDNGLIYIKYSNGSAQGFRVL